MSAVDKLSDEDKATFKDAFTSFVTGEDGAPLQIEQVGNVLRKMGQTPTLAEIEQYVLDVDPQYTGEVSYEIMLELYATYCKGQQTLEDEISKAFRTLDKENNGFIDVTELRHYMTSQGEPLTEDEVDEMIAFMDINGDGKILYEQFIKEENPE